MSRCKVSGCEFSTKSDEWFSSWRGRLQSTSMSTIGWRGHRVRFPPAFQHFSRKYQHPPTNIFDMAPHTPGVLRFGKLSKKPVAPAGYKNKQCRKQTSVLSGRIMTAYVPLRSATERERAAFLIPCQGLRDYFTNSQFTKHLKTVLTFSRHMVI